MILDKNKINEEKFISLDDFLISKVKERGVVNLIEKFLYCNLCLCKNIKVEECKEYEYVLDSFKHLFLEILHYDNTVNFFYNSNIKEYRYNTNEIFKNKDYIKAIVKIYDSPDEKLYKKIKSNMLYTNLNYDFYKNVIKEDKTYLSSDLEKNTYEYDDLKTYYFYKHPRYLFKNKIIFIFYKTFTLMIYFNKNIDEEYLLNNLDINYRKCIKNNEHYQINIKIVYENKIGVLFNMTSLSEIKIQINEDIHNKEYINYDNDTVLPINYVSFIESFTVDYFSNNYIEDIFY